jgi:hypothetical protein
MSGGDDLESDDEYLDQNWGKDVAVSVALDESVRNDERREQGPSMSKKRGISEVNSHGDDGDASNNGEALTTTTTSSSKKIKPISSRKLLLEAGRGISEETTDVQAQFLWACFTNALKLKGEEIPQNSINATHFKKMSKEKEREMKANAKNYDPSMAKFLKSGVLSSAKKLKKWKHSKSPMVLIICASAKRAVMVLKEISSLNVRAAKLFSKHMTIAEQTAMLENNKYSIGVGTPNRLLKLIGESDNGDNDNNGNGDDDDDKSKDEAPLNLDQTELVILDCHEDQKRFTVCTMNDTVPDLMMFLKEGVMPQLEKRKTLKLAFF